MRVKERVKTLILDRFIVNRYYVIREDIISVIESTYPKAHSISPKNRIELLDQAIKSKENVESYEPENLVVIIQPLVAEAKKALKHTFYICVLLAGIGVPAAAYFQNVIGVLLSGLPLTIATLVWAYTSLLKVDLFIRQGVIDRLQIPKKELTNERNKGKLFAYRIWHDILTGQPGVLGIAFLVLYSVIRPKKYEKAIRDAEEWTPRAVEEFLG